MIRPARADDASAIAEIWNTEIRDSAVTFTDVEKPPEEIAERMTSQTFLVVDVSGWVCAFATLGPFRSGPGYRFTAEHSLYVHADARGEGWGRTLMAQLETAARADGLRHLIAGIAGENTAAIAFHSRLGFEKVAELQGVGSKFGRAHDLVLMQKQL